MHGYHGLMQVILLVDVKKVGQRGSVITVADGYAMNVLIPQKKAVPATPENLKRVEKEALAVKGKKDMDSALAKKALAELHGKVLELQIKSNDAGVLFEAVKEKHVNEAISKGFNISLPESAIQLAEPIKKTGVYSIPVSIHGAKATISLQIR